MFRYAFVVAAFLSVPGLLHAQEEAVSGGSLEFGGATGEPGELVAVPVHATFEHPMTNLFVTFRYDTTRLEFLRYDVQGSAVSGANPATLNYRIFEGGYAAFGFHDTVSADEAKDVFAVPPGERRFMGRLQFRIRATAESGPTPVAPASRIPHTAATTQYGCRINGEFVTVELEVLSGGSVTVLPPSGPRPVGALSCAQFLDRVELVFSLTETYESIEVSRDGSPIATLEGSETSFADPIPGLGAFTYSVIADRDGESSIAVSCHVLVVSPAAPAPEHFRCGDDGLTWDNPVGYEAIVVLRDGEQIAELSGDAERFQDQQRPAVPTVYTVVGELEGFRSPEVNCIDHGIWVMEVGDVQVPLDAEKVTVPILVTTARSVQGFDCYLRVDMDRFELVRSQRDALAGTVGEPKPEYFQLGISAAFPGAPAAGVLYDHHAPIEEEKDLPVGLRQRVFNFTFRALGPFADGETFDVSFFAGSFVLRGGISQRVDLFIPGEIRFGDGGIEAVRNLEAQVDPAGEGAGAGNDGRTDVALRWQNGSRYDVIRIQRNGTTIAEVPGQSTEHRDLAVPKGVFTYKVVGLARGQPSFPATTLLSTLSPPGAFLRGDANRDGDVNLSDAIAALNFLFGGGLAPPCEDAADADDDGRLTITDPIIILNHLFLGSAVIRAPGTVYPWFDPTPDGLTCLE